MSALVGPDDAKAPPSRHHQLDVRQDLLNPAFEGYKFSGETLSVTAKALDGETQLRSHRISLGDERRFNVPLVTAATTHNQLHAPPGNAEDGEAPIAYFVAGKGQVCRVAWQPKQGGARGGEDVATEAEEDRLENTLLVSVVAQLPHFDGTSVFEMDNIVFADADTAVCSYGSGHVAVFTTRSSATAATESSGWKQLYHDTLEGQGLVLAASWVGEHRLGICYQTGFGDGSPCLLTVDGVCLESGHRENMASLAGARSPLLCTFIAGKALGILSSGPFIPQQPDRRCDEMAVAKRAVSLPGQDGGDNDLAVFAVFPIEETADNATSVVAIPSNPISFVTRVRISSAPVYLASFLADLICQQSSCHSCGNCTVVVFALESHDRMWACLQTPTGKTLICAEHDVDGVLLEIDEEAQTLRHMATLDAFG